ncbi:MAG: response regulator [Bacteroidota bacterium]
MQKILIIEDDTAIIENVSDFLKEEKFTVITAHNGPEGIQQALSSVPDLILCDINMPGMDGYQVCKTLQEVSTTSTIPFIFLTARSQMEDMRQGMQLGADDYIMKPFEFDDLLRAIKTRLDKTKRQQKAFSESINALLDNPIVPVFVFSENKFTYTNLLTSDLLGYSRSELNSLGFSDIAAGKDNVAALEKIERCMSGTTNSVHTSFKATCKDGKEILLNIYGIHMKHLESPAVVGNITEANAVNEKAMLENATKCGITNRELEIIQHICKGQSSSEIAEKLFISQRTVDTHRANIIEKCEVKNTAELIMYSIRNGFICF